MVLAGLGQAQPLTSLRKEIEQAQTQQQVDDALARHAEELGEGFHQQGLLVRDDFDDGKPVTNAERERLYNIVTAAESAHRSQTPVKSEPKQTATQALQKVGFKDPGKTTTKNWAGRGIDKMFDALSRWLKKTDEQTAKMPVGTTLFDFLTPIVWIVFGAAVVAFLAWALITFAGILRLKAKQAGGLIEEDEPERTADEWLTKAAELERQGEFRLAVRCLYVATLIRLDEGNVARFRRWETNWEHLHRIDGSPRKPAGYSIRPATEKFDVVWYGHQVEGKSDVELFRDWYREAMSAMGRRVS